MSTCSIGSDSRLPPIVRPCSARAALWINSHPKSTFLALCALAAGYGLALGLGGLSQDVFISFAIVGGVVLLVSAYVLKRLIYMSEVKRVQYLLGIDRLQDGDLFYYCDAAGIFHSISFTIDGDKSQISFDNATCLYLTGHEDRSYSGNYILPFFRASEHTLAKLRELIQQNDALTKEQMLSFALDWPGGPQTDKRIDIAKPFAVMVDEWRQITFQHTDNGGWVIPMTPELYRNIFNTDKDYTNLVRLIGPRFINTTLVNYLRDKIYLGQYKNGT